MDQFMMISILSNEFRYLLSRKSLERTRTNIDPRHPRWRHGDRRRRRQQSRTSVIYFTWIMLCNSSNLGCNTPDCIPENIPLCRSRGVSILNYYPSVHALRVRTWLADQSETLKLWKDLRLWEYRNSCRFQSEVSSTGRSPTKNGCL